MTTFKEYLLRDHFYKRGINIEYGVTFHKKSTYNVSKHPLSKRKFVPVTNHFTNATAKLVLFERNVEIKDLESKVKYLQNKIKELENENKTVEGIKSRHERELKKFKEGVADIPSLLRSHKEEIKVYESAICNIRREFRDCQKELKFRNESLLKKDNQIDKLNANLKRNEKMVHDFSSEIKELKISKKHLEEKNRMLKEANDNLKSENDDLYKKNKDLLNRVQNLEETINSEINLNKQLKDDLNKLQEKYEMEKHKVSSEQHIPDSEDQINFNIVEDSSKTSAESSHESGLKNESKKLDNMVVHGVEEKNLQIEKSVDKTKNALIHTFKCYQNLCNTKLINSNIRTPPLGTGFNNLKLLPPLKTPSRKISQTIISDLGNSEYFPSPADKNIKDAIKHCQCEELTKEFQCKLKTDVCEIDGPENRTTAIIDSLKEETPIYSGEPLQSCSKNWLNEDFRKDVQYNMKIGINEIHNPETTILNVIKEEEHCCCNETLKDDFKCSQREDLGKDVQCNLKIDNKESNFENKINVSRNFIKEKFGCFNESLKDGHTHRQNKEILKNVSCKSTMYDYERNRPENKISLIKQTVKTDKYNFEELSKENKSESHFELSWWDNW